MLYSHDPVQTEVTDTPGSLIPWAFWHLELSASVCQPDSRDDRWGEAICPMRERKLNGRQEETDTLTILGDLGCY